MSLCLSCQAARGAALLPLFDSSNSALLPLFEPSLSPRNTALVACLDDGARGPSSTGRGMGMDLGEGIGIGVGMGMGWAFGGGVALQG